MPVVVYMHATCMLLAHIELLHATVNGILALCAVQKISLNFSFNILAPFKTEGMSILRN